MRGINDLILHQVASVFLRFDTGDSPEIAKNFDVGRFASAQPRMIVAKYIGPRRRRIHHLFRFVCDRPKDVVSSFACRFHIQFAALWDRLHRDNGDPQKRIALHDAGCRS